MRLETETSSTELLSHMDKYRILIIEDDIAVMNSLRHILVRKGYDVLIALNGRVGIKKFIENEIDVVILDIKMPFMDGFEVVTELQKMEYTVPIIIFTGYGTKNHRIRAKEKGIFEFISKPCDNNLILTTVKKAIDFTRTQDKSS